MNSEQRIIDRDITFYNTVAQEHHAKLKRCLPSQEKRQEELRRAAQAVVDALIVYRLALDNGKESLKVGDTVRLKDEQRVLRGVIQSFGDFRGEDVANVGEGDYSLMVAVNRLERVN